MDSETGKRRKMGMRGKNKRENNDKDYMELVKYHRIRTAYLGYHEPEFIWKQSAYEEARRNMLNGTRVGK